MNGGKQEILTYDRVYGLGFENQQYVYGRAVHTTAVNVKQCPTTRKEILNLTMDIS